jgi:nucleoside-diphosphate-sugar epimerase
MRHLIIGGGGFVGSNICARLLADGDEPIAFDARTSSVLPQLVGEDAARQIFVQGDATDGLAVLDVAKSRGAESIINVLTFGSTNLREYFRVVFDSFINAFEVAHILGIKRIVYASSESVVFNYGEGDLVTADSYWPDNTYGGGKILIEMIAKHYAVEHDTDSAGMRIPLILGPGLPRGHVPPTEGRNPHPADVLDAAMLVEILDKPKHGLPARVPFADDVAEWMWAGDIARGFALAARSSLPGPRIYHIDGDVRPLREAIETVRRLIPGADIEGVPGKHGNHRTYDLQPVREDLGWNGPEWRMEDIIAWYLEGTGAGR